MPSPPAGPEPISALPVAGPLNGTELVPIVQGSTTKRTTTAELYALLTVVDTNGLTINTVSRIIVNNTNGLTLNGGVLGDASIGIQVADGSVSATPGVLSDDTQYISGRKYFISNNDTSFAIYLQPSGHYPGLHIVDGSGVFAFQFVYTPGGCELNVKHGLWTAGFALSIDSFGLSFFDLVTTGSGSVYGCDGNPGVSGVGGGGDEFTGGICTLLGSGGSAPWTENAISGDYTIGSSDQFVNVDAQFANIIITLPDPASVKKQEYVIYCSRNNGGLNSVQVESPGFYIDDDNSYFPIIPQHGILRFFPSQSGSWYVTGYLAARP